MTRWLRTIALGLVFGGAALAADPPESTDTPKPAIPPSIDIYAPAPAGAARTIYATAPAAAARTIDVSAPAVAATPGIASTPSKPASQSGRRKLEAQLQSPAGLDFGDRPHVTAKDILDQLRERHDLSFRLDVPTLASLFGTGSTTPNKCQVAGQTLPGANYGAYYAPAGAELSPGIASPAPAVATYAPGVTFPSPAPAAAAPSTTAAPPIAAAAPAATRPSPVPAAPAPAAAAAPPVATSAPAAPSTSNNGSDIKPVGKPDTEPKCEPKFDSPAEADPLLKSKSESTPEKPSLASLLDVEVDVQTIDLKNVSIATVLRHALDAVSPPAGYEELGGMPIPVTNAVVLDYLVEDDGLLVTTRMRALTHKETRVYSVKHLPNVPSEQLAKTVRQSVRPWSWRAQITDMGEQLKGTPLPAETLGNILKTGAQLVGGELGATVTISDALTPTGIPGSVVTADGATPAPAQKDSQSDELKAAAMMGNAAVNGLVTFIQATLASLEMFHYAEPPTATIQTLEGKLVITQSQTAHREIAELLEQLAEE
jgi:hypothetical protein